MREVAKKKTKKPAAAKQKRAAGKRKAQRGVRVLLPDAPAPPRKRNTRRLSPERHQIEFVVTESALAEQGDDGQPLSQNLEFELHSGDTELQLVNGQTAVDPGPSTSTVTRISKELKLENTTDLYGHVAVVGDFMTTDPGPSTSAVTRISEELKLENTTDLYGDVAVVGDFMTTDADNANISFTVANWLETNAVVDSDDDDLDVDIDSTIPLTTTDDYAENGDLRPADIAILEDEETQSDRFLRDLVPSEDYFDFQWTNDRWTFTGQREAFTGNAGPTFPVTDRPIDVFYKMFDSDFIDLLVTETNRYADQTLTALRQNPNSQKFARVLRWKETDRDEIVTFLAIIILQGLYPKVREEAYFKGDGFGSTPYFSTIMSYNRYNLLRQFLHFVDNTTSTDRTKLNKIRPVIDYLNKKFSSLYMPKQEIAIDESLLKWHGRLSFSQKIKTKAAKVGLKTYELCESSSGYLWKFFVYSGKDSTIRPTERPYDGPNDGTNDELPVHNNGDNVQTTGTRLKIDKQTSAREICGTSATAKIVYDLIEPLLHRGHVLVMDNFYNSPLLARCLKRQQTDVFGTLRLTREFVPKDLKTLTKSDMRHGEAVVCYCADLGIMVWRDVKLVGMISTFHALPIGTEQRSNRLTHKPAIVNDYNKFMGGVDLKDQFLSSQPLERQRTKIWYKKLFRRLYNDALHNCFTIFKAGNPLTNINQRQFRKILAEDLLRVHKGLDISNCRLTLKQTTTATPTATQTFVTVQKRGMRPFVKENHFPKYSGSRFNRCWMCYRKKLDKRTVYKCEECDVSLCVIGCFKEYHKPSQ